MNHEYLLPGSEWDRAEWVRAGSACDDRVENQAGWWLCRAVEEPSEQSPECGELNRVTREWNSPTEVEELRSQSCRVRCSREARLWMLDERQ